MAIGPNTFQCRTVWPIGLQLDKRRTKPGAPVTQASQKLIAGHAAPQPGSRKAAAGDDQSVTFHPFLLCFHQEAGSGLANLFCFKSQFQCDVRPFQRKAEYVHHGVCLIGIGIDTA